MCLFTVFMDAVRDAVLVAAGLGTRMFPTSAFLPKESLPLVDVPLLTHLLLEAKEAGIERLHIVTSKQKSFDGLLTSNPDRHRLRPDLDPTLFSATEGMEVLVHHQHEPKGVANAIEAALHAVEGPFLVMLGDNVLMDVHASTQSVKPSTTSKRLLEMFAQCGEATVALMEVEADEVQHYGVVAMNGSKITAMVEKPQPHQAPSRLAMCGRYVFPATTKALLETYTFEAHGDLQSIALQQHWIDEGALHGLVLEDTQWYDSGAPLMWLQAQVDHALRRPDLQTEFAGWLRQRLEDHR